MKASPKITVNIITESEYWQEQSGITESKLKAVARYALRHTPILLQYRAIEISILLANDQSLQEMNRKFRNTNRPTNVLSFPAMEISSTSKRCYLGDVALSYETIYQEAQTYNKSFYERAMHMVVHGVLHLLGYDHIQKEERLAMENLEAEILQHFKVTNLYYIDE